MKKKYLLFMFSAIIAVALFSVVGFASAQLKDWSNGQNVDLESSMTSVMGAIGYFFGFLAVIMFVASGILFLTAQGDPGKLDKAKQSLLWGFVGVAVGIIAFSIIGITQGILGGGQ